MRSPFSGLRSAALEFRNLRANGWLMFSVCVIALIPLIYAGLFLLAFLDPYGSLVNVPAAVVNLDEGAVIDDEDRNVGQELCDELVKNNEDRTEGEATGYDWKFTTEDAADAGLRDASYYMELIIPKNFSQTIADADSDDPQQAELMVYFNPSTNLIAQTVGSSMVTKIKAELNTKIQKEYFDQIFVSIKDASDSLTDAVDGSDELASGLSKLEDGSDTLTDGLKDAQDGSHQIADGATQLKDGSSTLTDGLVSAQKGSKKLTDGAKSAEKGSKSLTEGIKSAKDGSQTISDNLGTLSAGASQVSAGVQSVASGLKQIDDGIEAAQSSSAQLSQVITGVGDALTGYASTGNSSYLTTAATLAAKAEAANATVGTDLNTYVQKLIAALQEYQSAATSSATKKAEMEKSAAALQAAAQTGDATKIIPALTSYQTVATEYQKLATAEAGKAAAAKEAQGDVTGYLKGLQNMSSATSESTETIHTAIEQLYTAVSGDLTTGVNAIASGATQLKAGSDSLTSGLETAYKGSSDLTTGLTTLRKGTQSLTTGISTAADGSKKITYNLGTAADGANSLADGLDSAVDGSAKITKNLGTAKDGADELYDGLKDGQEEMSDSVKDSDAKSEMMSQPVTANGDQETGEKITQVNNYGTGFAPYFIGLGMWVGCLMVTFVVRSMNNRLLMSHSSSLSAVVSSYIPMLLIAFIQVIVLLLFIQFGLGFSVNFPLQYYLFGLLVAACFIAIIQFMRAAFGTAGLVIVVILLMVQLCTAAGTFPIEAELPIFNWLNPFLPMTYVVQGFRMAMCGLSAGLMTKSAIVLACFTVGFLALSTLLAHKRRRATMSTLYPKIQMVH